MSSFEVQKSLTLPLYNRAQHLKTLNSTKSRSQDVIQILLGQSLKHSPINRLPKLILIHFSFINYKKKIQKASSDRHLKLRHCSYVFLEEGKLALSSVVILLFSIWNDPDHSPHGRKMSIYLLSFQIYIFIIYKILFYS